MKLIQDAHEALAPDQKPGRRRAGVVSHAVLMLATLGLVSGCPEDAAPGGGDSIVPGGVEQLAEQCGLTCGTLASGTASVSGIPSFDAFFAAVLNFEAKAALVSTVVTQEMAKLKLVLNLEQNATATEIVAAISAQYKLSGSFQAKVQPPRCQVTAQATVQATAKCDASVTPGSASVKCEGKCVAEASAMATCEAGAELRCRGTAPSLACDAECRGSCELDVAAGACEGKCTGTCEGTCELTNAMGQCQGACAGNCTGTCEVEVAAQCTGRCKGECDYTPATGMCEANAQATCTGMANAKVECKGTCEGKVEPPAAKAECQASAKAEAEMNAECTPPALAFSYQFMADADVETRARFQGFLVTMRGSLEAILEARARANVVLAAGADLGATGVAAVDGAIKSAGTAANAKMYMGLYCAGLEVGKVGGVLTAASSNLTASVTAATELAVALGAT